MKKPISAIMVAMAMATVVPTQSFALPPVPPVEMPMPLSGGGGGGGAGAAAGIIGVAAFFVFYDIGRRTTCSGDFLQLGGPGFSTLWRRWSAIESHANDRQCHARVHGRQAGCLIRNFRG
jgi:hypothetical protein